MKAEPVIILCYFGKADDQLVVLLGQFWILDEDVALSFGYSKDPVFAFEVVYFDLEATIQKPWSDVFSWQLSYILQRNVDSNLDLDYFTNFF